MIKEVEKIIKLTKKIKNPELTDLVEDCLMNAYEQNHYDRLIRILENELKTNPK